MHMQTLTHRHFQWHAHRYANIHKHTYAHIIHEIKRNSKYVSLNSPSDDKEFMSWHIRTISFNKRKKDVFLFLLQNFLSHQNKTNCFQILNCLKKDLLSIDTTFMRLLKAIFFFSISEKSYFFIIFSKTSSNI